MSLPVIIIFDVGKTNKKLLLFDQQYRLVSEESVQLAETTDEDGFNCEDVDTLSKWVWQTFERICSNTVYDVKGINFSAYGASFVHLDDRYKPLTPLYNYLKPYPNYLHEQFYNTYGGESLIAKQTASPVLGNLNSGLQLYRLKYEKPELFSRINFSLHLPQYLSFIISSKTGSDITSIGCHTLLWNFTTQTYHDWVVKEGITTKLAPLYKGNEPISMSDDIKKIPVGVGLHDSSSALIPYLTSFPEPFILLSTGTWCISLNPFNSLPLTDEELKQDCLCYLTYWGQPVKASRLFAGYEHQQQTKRLADHYNKPADYSIAVKYDHEIIIKLKVEMQNNTYTDLSVLKTLHFSKRDLANYATYEEAYHQLIVDIVQQQVISTQLILRGTEVKRIFVDGGFSKNLVYMNLLAAVFLDIDVFAATVPHATALGAALSLHKHWNPKPIPGDLIQLKYYPMSH